MNSKIVALLLGFSILASNAQEQSIWTDLATRKSIIIPALALGGSILATGAIKCANSYYHGTHYENWTTFNPLIYNDQYIVDIFKEHREKLAGTEHPWIWGVATSAHQVEGGSINNDWYEWTKLKTTLEKGIVAAGDACDHWNRYKEDIQLIKKTGANVYRFEIAFDKVMPAPGVIDKTALAHYKDVCIELVRNGIKPVVTLYHQPRPTWFSQLTRTVAVDDTHFPHLKKLVKPGEPTLALQSWEDPQNIPYFVLFCVAVVRELHPYVHLWLTFNRPEGYAFQGWQQGNIPPNKKSMPLAAEVLKNLLEAHVTAYRAIKHFVPTAKVGILKNSYEILPFAFCNPLDQLASVIANELQNECVFRFFKTGTFSLQLPFSWLPVMVNISHTNEYVARGGKCNDFIGVNCYGGGYMDMFQRVHDTEREIVTENPNYTIFPEAFYRGVKNIAKNLAEPFRLPIYLTENGIGTNSDVHRSLFTKRYLQMVARLIKEGINIHGYMWWSLMDNYEWGTFKPRYGLLHIDFKTQKRTFKEGARTLINIMHASQNIPMPRIPFVPSEKLSK